MARTNILIPDAMLAQAKQLDINLSAVARKAVAAEIKSTVKSQDLRWVTAWRDDEPISFYAKFLEMHPFFDDNVFLTTTGKIVVLFVKPHGDPENDRDWGMRVYDTVEKFAKDNVDVFGDDTEEDRRAQKSVDRWVGSIIRAVGPEYATVVDL